ncbi:MAG: carboxymuconolactone decarboxylase family protein [Dehalococcoidia bacterium]|jgi:AhpD family alkylhydroperoxidase|nr:carboxymuconolactone decarboxylase family protein [Dehalococcoidia bacterium]
MTRQEVYKDIEETLGSVPGFLKTLPDSTLELEWRLMKASQMEPGAVPNKYRELIGIGVAAATKCRYCIFFHHEMAKLEGATDAEIEDAIHFAKSTSGWSTYIQGLDYDYDEFKKEVRHAAEYVRKMQQKKAA